MNKEKRLRFWVSFPEYEKELYDFVVKQKNSSALIRRLIREYMLDIDKENNNSNNQFVIKHKEVALSTKPIKQPIQKATIETNDYEKELWKNKIKMKKQIMQRCIKSKSD